MTLLDMKRPSNQLAVFLFAIGSGIIINSVITAVLMINYPIDEMLNNAGMMRCLSFLSQIFVFLLPSLVLFVCMRKEHPDYLHLRTFPSNYNLILTLLLVFLSVPMMSWIVGMNESVTLPESMSKIEEWLKHSEEEMAVRSDMMLHTDSWDVLCINILVVALCPAFCEEILFRGVLMNWLGQVLKNKHVAVWLSAIIFSACHMQFYGFIPRMLLGAAFGYLVVWTKSLWTSMIAHFINNLSAVVLAFAYCRGKLSTSYNEPAVWESHWSVITLSIVCTMALLYLLHVYNTRKLPNS